MNIKSRNIVKVSRRSKNQAKSTYTFRSLKYLICRTDMYVIMIVIVIMDKIMAQLKKLGKKKQEYEKGNETFFQVFLSKISSTKLIDFFNLSSKFPEINLNGL